MLWFLALISSYPDVQAKAHTELDTVIGRDYWPSVEDEQRLPYIRAIIKEVRALHEHKELIVSHIFLGGACALAVLDGYTPLFY